MTDTRPSFLAKNHPIRAVLEEAARGNRPTKAQLNQLAAYDAVLPTDDGIGRFAFAVDRAAARVVGVAQTGAFKDARDEAENAWARIAERMGDSARAVDGNSLPDTSDESLDAIASRIYRNG
ncbi:hypothetical protein [Solicola gregarius]|uniref:Uncharacterized protein n=1 Tax=Solicola gregarius TaxID=2908642 RepID=A0AA46YJG3_9ACTN|nr:hypothetical protein [Solicola gregarius]UYM03446.1 hypothetical protein L0C25_12855 [Solicola gregarius]